MSFFFTGLQLSKVISIETLYSKSPSSSLKLAIDPTTIFIRVVCFIRPPIPLRESIICIPFPVHWLRSFTGVNIHKIGVHLLLHPSYPQHSFIIYHSSCPSISLPCISFISCYSCISDSYCPHCFSSCYNIHHLFNICIIICYLNILTTYFFPKYN